MTSWMKNQRANFYNIASASVAATKDALTDRLSNVCETASLRQTAYQEKRVIMMLWEKQEEVEDAQDVGSNTDDKYIKTEMSLTD